MALKHKELSMHSNKNPQGLRHSSENGRQQANVAQPRVSPNTQGKLKVDDTRIKVLSMSHRKKVSASNSTHRYLLSAEARELLRCSKRTLIRLYHGYHTLDGSWVRPVLSSVRRGGRILFERTAIESFMQNRTTAVR